MSTGLDFKLRKTVQRGTRANQPAATDVPEGGLYWVTDEKVFERSTGAAWQAVHPGLGKYSALVYRTTTLSIANVTGTVIGFDSEDYDNGGLHSTSVNTSRITIPTGGDGYYCCFGAATFEPNGTGGRATILAKNGAAVGAQCTTGAVASLHNCPFITKIIHLAAADYIEIIAYQDSGGNLNVGNASLRNTQPELGVFCLTLDTP